ncbi:MAG: hypothetical protein K0S76_2815 [Herbinix sp.]|jgi:predicted 3-demethylubiquinone-9 3-methyltransferase (glyoxalase superfamily)|nr:hypothetical protein [Herbinix sp.]
MQKIIPHLWFDREADEASQFYMSLFEGSELINKTVLNNTPSGTADLITIRLAGQEFMLISAGPYFKFTPAVSFLIACETVAEVEMLWEKLIRNGEALMPLGSYPFSDRYGWVIDKYGLSWQVMLSQTSELKHKITPTVMFVGEQCGKAEEAIEFYTTIFHNSKINYILRYGEDAPPNQPEMIQHMEYKLENQDFAAMDSAYDHDFTFNEAVSFVVNCDSQEEIDYYWEKLSYVSEAEQCGWLKDKYGFSWQITPTIMNDMLQNKDADKIAKVTDAFLKMKKFDIAELIKAYEE